ncbi:MAG: excinuclease ABC subunit UvrA [Acidobacteriota bacterium]
MGMDEIRIRGAAEHNLKSIDLVLPRNKLIVFTGLSGSGKSSLAFDTIYAEGQRRYVESLSAYARQFLELMEKPDVELIEGLSPAISIEQKTTSKNPRSTVGTVTEIHDYLRVLFARIGRPHCHRCGKPIAAQTVQQITDQLLKRPEKTRLTLLAPVVRGRKGEYRRQMQEMMQKGFVRARVDGKMVDLATPPKLDKHRKHAIEVVVDRLAVRSKARQRLTEAVETCIALADGLVRVVIEPAGGAAEEIVLSDRLACIACGVSVSEMSPRMFSFNSPYGACPACDGLGVRRELDPDKIVPDPSRSIDGGAIQVPGIRNSFFSVYMAGLKKSHRFSTGVPWKKLSATVRRLILHGGGEREYRFVWNGRRSQYTFRGKYEGVIPSILRKYQKTSSSRRRAEFDRLMSLHACATCKGERLRPESLAVTLADHNISHYNRLSIEDAEQAFRHLRLASREKTIAAQVLKEIRQRLGFLLNVGLGYLSLDRSAATLSGGEGQRIRLATQIGSQLTGVLYVLDEPSIGLHQRDNRRLLTTLERMRDLGNTVIVVEHDEATIRAADHVVDLGPGAGEHGGEVVAAGPPAAIEKCPTSLTGQYLAGRQSVATPERRRPGNGRRLTVRGATEHNLQGIDVTFPLATFTCVTGVSGSGKSTLVNDILYKALTHSIYDSQVVPGRHRKIEGMELVDKIIAINQAPIGRTPRSNPSTYIGLFTPIRDLFAQTPESRVRGYRPGRYSFNVKGGRCEACQGDGLIKIEMHFLPDVYITCETCEGKRYNRETLEIHFKGKTISDVLEMTVEEALRFFANIPVICGKLQTLDDVGLGYIRLGQQATTLSGGEAQRIKLAKELSKRSTGRTFYVLDEPTTGLHFDDVRKLLAVLNRLVDEGNTIVVIEHNLDVIKCADHVIDLGPEGGDRGGTVVAQGTPDEVAHTPGSHTGVHLRRILASHSRSGTGRPTRRPALRPARRRTRRAGARAAGSA